LAGGWINYFGRVGHVCSKGSVGKLGQRKLCLHTYSHQLHIALRYVHVYAEGRSSRHPEQLIARTVGNIRSDINVTRGDNAVEWRPQEPEGFQCIQSLNICLVRGHFSLVFPIGISRRVTGLCIQNLLIKETLVTLIGHLGQFEC
jgi:hypothetical protein